MVFRAARDPREDLVVKGLVLAGARADSLVVEAVAVVVEVVVVEAEVVVVEAEAEVVVVAAADSKWLQVKRIISVAFGGRDTSFLTHPDLERMRECFNSKIARRVNVCCSWG